MATKRGRIVTYMDGPLPVDTWPFGHMALQNHVTYFVTSAGDLLCEAPIIYSNMTFNQVVMLDRKTIWKMYICTFTRHMATKLGRMLTSKRRFSTQTQKSSPTSCFFVCLFGFFTE